MFTTTSEGTTVNCYLVWDEVSRAAALFDTGFDAKPILDCIAENQLDLKYIFITHSHYDHVTELPKIRAAFPKVRVRSSSKNAPVDQRNKTAEIVHLGGLRVTHRETPGHAEDGVTYMVGNWQEDAPYRGGGGRHDFRRLNGPRQPGLESGETKSARTDFNPAGGHLALPGPRAVDDGGGGEGT